MFSRTLRVPSKSITSLLVSSILSAIILTSTTTTKVQGFLLRGVAGVRRGAVGGVGVFGDTKIPRFRPQTTKSRRLHYIPPSSQGKYQGFNHNIIFSRMATTMSAASTSDSSNSNNKGLFLFDFDGVVCDSCDECTVSALRTLQTLKVMDTNSNNDDSYPPDWLFAEMREIRPAIEVGWQIPVLLSVFWEQHQSSNNDKILSIPDIIANYETLVEGWLSKNELAEQDMVESFGNVRDQWIQNDMKSWLDINTFYSQVPQSLNSCIGKSVLVTTKQQRFAIALCRHAGVSSESLPDESIYGLGQYKKKSDVIFEEMTSGKYLKEDTHFFEDRWPTLVKCLNDDRLIGVNLYLCAWGYCTSEELKKAEAEPRVTVLQLDEFANLVQGK